jgi:histidyl-tRNA synthetase
VPAGAPEAYAIVTSAAVLEKAMPVIEGLRASGMRVFMHAGGGSLKTQLQKADASGARVAFIFGEQEVAANQFKIKPLRDRDAPQTEFPLLAEVDATVRLREELSRRFGL